MEMKMYVHLFTCSVERGETNTATERESDREQAIVFPIE